MLNRKAFTLIELLIVVAIIAILAAIAVPNFLEAQTRSKVARTQADLRTLATGIEAYTVDYNQPPREWDQAIDGPLNGSTGASGIMSPVLSTPVAYLTTALYTDPFVQAGENLPEDEKTFSYANVIERLRVAEDGGSAFFFGFPGGQLDAAVAVQNSLGAWYSLSIGPDRRYDNNIDFNPGGGQIQRDGIRGREYIPYDPTNGTLSEGNILRSQRLGQGGYVTDTNVLDEG